MNNISKGCFYRNWYEMANLIQDEHLRLQFYEMITKYMYEGIEPESTNPLYITFLGIKPNIDADIKRKDGGAPFGNQNAKKTTKKQPKNNVENNLKQPKTTTKTIKTNDEDVNEDEDVEEDAHEDVNVADVSCVCLSQNIKNNEDTTPMTDEDIKNWQDFQKQSYNLIQEHNNNSEYSKKLCISNSFSSYLQKECRDIISDLRHESPAIIYKALQNYLLIAKSDTWKKSFSIKDFVNNFATYSDKDFNVFKFLRNNSEQLKSVTEIKKELTPEELETQLLQEMRNNTEFIPTIFNFYKDDWISEGCPLGYDYLLFQNDKEQMPYGQKLKAQFLAQGA